MATAMQKDKTLTLTEEEVYRSQGFGFELV